MDILLKICLVVCCCFIGGKLAKLAKLPNVSGYLIAGLFIVHHSLTLLLLATLIHYRLLVI
jgi:Kef-type K+ transport system membrane component KefB